MDRQGVKEFIKEVLGPNTSVKDQGRWVSMHCPFARWKHPKGSDKNMSFGISVNEADESICNCFTCKTKGPLPYFLRQLERYTGDDFSKLIDGIQNEEFLSSRLPEWGTSNTQAFDALGEPLHEDYLDLYDPAYNHPYLEDRGVDYETAKLLDLRVDTEDSRGDERILFPVYSKDGGFYGYTGRAVENEVEPRIRDYYGLPKGKLLLGAEWIQDKDKHVALVEGLFDYAKFFMYGIPVVAALHSSLTTQQARILRDIGKTVYLFFDNDEAGGKGNKEVIEALRDYVPLMKVRYPGPDMRQPARHGMVLRKGSRQEVIGDPGVLTKEQALRMIATARIA